ncbi:tryptophan-rich sensory protein [Rhodoblastus acidophilus]|uniref:Tryptophan-rich sensory protein n=1 Tax=Candidatus Rhodoblastus alkanivorans TaxID=2954117 RepID=A0ABS9Z587_9HYPH|nr:TspO/MBR family protein [Candidatus Rhodoblastus alkanivorans]MCI4677718.1 tryptophan-rich sensory protein [Candidatus Rhodoblastus alkanivorans]MCI4682550.1 tryptophan-rich sensory protein [Candidatus Rhodoblastus alkanivorans]MDI4639856.1 tryptophan-rich sensory protein [Rhodoblastus acidophilus]
MTASPETLPPPGSGPAHDPAPGMAPRRAAVIAVGLVFFDSLLGQLATIPNITPWYEGLAKPSFTPPNAVFGPVWTLLYALMALAFWRILIQPKQKARSLAIGVFLAQLALNVIWSYAFFAAHSPLLGLIDIIPQEILVVATTILFWRLDRLAGLCLLPLALWVGYAAVLNLAVWRLNG